MKPEQAFPNLAWIDEELRREKALVAELRDQIDNQSVLIEAQAGRMRDMQERLAAMQAELHRISEVERSLQQTKDEIAALLHNFLLERRKEEKQFLETRRLERESDMQTLANLAKEIERIAALEARLEAQEAEDQRLRETILKMRQTVEEYRKEMADQAERLRVLESGLQRTNETLVQLRIPELIEVQKDQADRLALVEQWAEKSSQRAAEMQAFRAEIQASQDQLLETQRRVERQRQKQMAEWGRRMENLSHRLESWSTQMQHFAEQHEQDRQIVREMQELGQQLRQELEQIKQIQRIAEEQQRRELREWQGENEKRWNRHLELWQLRLEEQSKLDLVQTERIEQLETWHQEEVNTLKELAEMIEANHRRTHAELSQFQQDLLDMLTSVGSAFKTFEESVTQNATRGKGEAQTDRATKEKR